MFLWKIMLFLSYSENWNKHPFTIIQCLTEYMTVKETFRNFPIHRKRILAGNRNRSWKSKAMFSWEAKATKGSATKREDFASFPLTSHTFLHLNKSHSCCSVSFLKRTLESVTNLNDIHLSPSLFPFSTDLLLGETDRHQVHKIGTGEWNTEKKREEKREK